MFSGNAKPFQAGVVSLNIGGVSVSPTDGSSYGEYYRVIKDVDISSADETFQLLDNVRGVACLQESPIVVRVSTTKEYTGNLSALLKKFESCARVRVERVE